MANDRESELRAELLRRELAARRQSQQQQSPQQQLQNMSQDNFLPRAGRFAEQNINQPFEKYVVNPAIGAIGGAEETIANVIPGISNLARRAQNLFGADLPMSKGFHFTPEQYRGLGHTAGEAAGYFAGPGLLRAGSRIAENLADIPQLARLLNEGRNIFSKSPALQKAAEVTGSIGQNALLGVTMTPEQQGLGAALGGIGGALPYAKEAYQATKNMISKNEPIQNLIKQYSPSRFESDIANKTNEINKNLSLGSTNLQQNSKSLASDIRNAYDMRKQEAGVFFDYPLKQAGEELIYTKPDPLITTAIDKGKNLIDRAKEFNVGKIYEEFKKRPTFQNAHALQSELGDMLRTLESNPKTSPEEIKQINNLNSVRETLKNDIFDFLKNRDLRTNESLLNPYQQGIDLYRENVAPYLSNKKLLSIVKEGKTAVKDIHSIFHTPSNIVNKAGQEEIGPINKIMQDLPKESNNKILFSAMGGNKKDANSLLTALEKITNKGYSEYFHPELLQDINALRELKMSQEKALKSKEKLVGRAKALGTGAGLIGLGSLGTTAVNKLL